MQIAREINIKTLNLKEKLTNSAILSRMHYLYIVLMKVTP